MWRLKRFVIAVVVAVLAFCGGVLLMSFVASPARGDRPPPEYHCEAYIYPRIWCEAKYVDPFNPEWSLYLENVRVEYEDGVYVYLTVADGWERVEVCLLNHCARFQVRWHNKQIQFRTQEGES